MKTRLMSKAKEDDNGCWVWQPYKDKDGYGKIDLKINGIRSCIGAHRVSYATFIGAIPEGVNVLHHCDNPACINPEHLFLGTQKDNMEDMYAKGRENYLVGESCSWSKLAENKVKVIRATCKYTNLTNKEIGEIFNVKSGTISAVNNRRRWKHVK